ncbi:MAG TPA: hydantoinase B/oxoprolinase family protein [Rhizomicrobium sp.]|jgi:5-oxoprolinase (ATP-hydrolysing)|nr:hydantoinase B/oxoprolinase family protein [Rhizomicrobium sp.]
MSASSKWRFYIDRGGTFTDIVAEAPDGALSGLKLLSEHPDYEDAALEGIRRYLGVASSAPIPAKRVAEVRMGTTVATNALLTRTGEPLVLITTRGFKDQLRIGYQNRPKLFALKIELADMLYARVIEADERVTSEGEMLRPLDEAGLRAKLAEARAEGFSACAIVFLHGYRHPAHERRAAEIARELGFGQISISHDTVPLMKFVSRGDTTVADAYLSPVLSRYADRVSRALGGVKLYFMTSNGGLASPQFFRGKDAIASGPAGGVIAMAETGREGGFDRVIGFDMGGTSTDVARFDGTYERVYETELAGVRLRVPMLALNTVAAGGGSILHYNSARFRVGPDSAGADPGPKCYRRGGPLCVTDANVMVGKLRPEYFPHIFGPNANQPLDHAGVSKAFAALASEIADGRSPEQVADGFIRIAVENMANAIKRISVAKGYDVRDYTLNCFGGAGGQHACLVADALGVSRIFIHPFSGVLSAYGMKLAQLRSMRQRAIGQELAPSLVPVLLEAATELGRQTEANLFAQSAKATQSSARAHIRYEGSDTTMPVALASLDEMTAAFAEAHARLFGFGFEGKRLIVESIEVETESSTYPPPPAGEVPSERERSEAEGGISPFRLPHASHSAVTSPASGGGQERSRFFSGGAWHEAVTHCTEDLESGTGVNGPALLIEPHQTIVIEPGWQAQVTEQRAVVLTRTGNRAAHRASTEADPVLLEVFTNLFMAIAEEMGATLQNTASSVNIKERLDFSCAIFDADGGLVANAPHMPVHLGSMGDCVTAVMRKHAEMREGDMFVTNAPYDGGTHIPDVTVVAPVFVQGERCFFVASRGHHADIGGITPGSMPAFSKDISEEGVLFDGVPLVHGGHFDENGVRGLLETGEYPARNPAQNIADLKAQAASCMRGSEELKRICTLYGANIVTAYMLHVQDNAEESVRKVIGALTDGEFAMPTDGGAEIRVKITVDREHRIAQVDFTGTSPQQPNNLNAPRSVTKAAVLYVFRCLVDSDIPMNAGCLKPLEIVVPEGSLLNPRPPAAVAGGNVETSQAVVDVLFGALGVMAAAQGTMNNLTFGNERHQYYETICGGAGAGADFGGQSAVQTHMTNSRLTDPEVLESRYPVLLEEFSIREGSGGNGKHRGGDGAFRRIRFREPMTAAILSTRRETAPFGLNGGEDAKPGVNTVVRVNGEQVTLKGRDEVTLEPGDQIVIATPGGGGFGGPQ